MIPYLIEQHKQKKYPLEKLIKTYAITDFDDAIKDAKSGSTIKAVLKWI
jgi:Zn-dependent alcohol dehydrogenase